MLRGHYNQHKRIPYEKLDWVPELPIFQEVVRLYLEDERSNAEILLALMRALLLSLMKRTATYRTRKVHKAVRDNQVLLHVLGYLDACYQENININQLADRCNITLLA